jgi:hypothetical protein
MVMSSLFNNVYKTGADDEDGRDTWHAEIWQPSFQIPSNAIPNLYLNETTIVRLIRISQHTVVSNTITTH